MIGTFAALAADPNLSHGEALQKAMLAMIDDPTRPWAKPKFWAPFVVGGNQQSRATELTLRTYKMIDGRPKKRQQFPRPSR